MFGPPSIGLVPTAPDWPAWVGHMVTTHFDLVSGLSWAPGGPKRAPFGPKCPLALNFHGPILCGNFFSKYRLVGGPEYRSGMLCSSSTVIVHIEPPSLRKRPNRGKEGPFLPKKCPVNSVVRSASNHFYFIILQFFFLFCGFLLFVVQSL